MRPRNESTAKKQPSDPGHEQRPLIGERGQVGIGSLILFIALVIVAAISAGVLINTAGFFQSEGTGSGEELPPQVTIASQTGEVANGSIETVSLTVKRSPDADTVDLSTAVIEWLGPNGQTELTYGNATAEAHSNSTFAVSAVQEDEGTASVPTLDSQADTFTLTIDATAIVDGGLAPGTDVELTLITASGATHIVELQVPESLAGETAVAL